MIFYRNFVHRLHISYTIVNITRLCGETSNLQSHQVNLTTRSAHGLESKPLALHCVLFFDSSFEGISVSISSSHFAFLRLPDVIADRPQRICHFSFLSPSDSHVGPTSPPDPLFHCRDVVSATIDPCIHGQVRHRLKNGRLIKGFQHIIYACVLSQVCFPPARFTRTFYPFDVAFCRFVLASLFFNCSMEICLAFFERWHCVLI